MMSEPTSGADTSSALPDHLRPVATTAFHTEDLPPLPQRDIRLPAHLWIEAPTWLIELGADFGAELVTYKRRIGNWYLWRAGPATGDHACYSALAVDDLSQHFEFRLQPDGSGSGLGPGGATYTRFRTWKEALLASSGRRVHRRT